MSTPLQRTAAELDLPAGRVEAVVKLLDEGSTVPFISRYRKEVTGNADDATIAKIAERIAFHRELEDRRATILSSIDEQGKLTPELRKQIEDATTKTELEDLYLPYRPKRRTRATIARERGLEPLADRMWAQPSGKCPPPTTPCRARATSWPSGRPRRWCCARSSVA